MKQSIAIGLILLTLLLAGCAAPLAPGTESPDANSNPIIGPEPPESGIPFPDANTGSDQPPQLPF
jgi:PBP1b-binding outer membrane lipoprotein LpoB